ncbi:MAG: nucleotide exchange factor GrpE, partial [Oscillibacter sp.]|nr:nucleotide exchange factor GrpE [Oscillibacter sp.]
MAQENTDSKSQEPTAEDAEPVAETQGGAEASEETYTLTRAQMERMEEAAKELETVKDQYVRQAAEYDNY